MNARTITACRAGVAVLAAGAFAASYGHQYELYRAYDCAGWSYVYPLLVDVLALLAAAVRSAGPSVTAKGRRLATWTLLFTGVGSMAANVADGHNIVQRIAGFVVVALFLFAERLVSTIKPT